jgi:predicted RNase H-like HicB family nuclease
MPARKSYVVRYQLDETGWWLATVPTVPGCHTQGRTLEQAEKRIREALALFVPDSVANKSNLVSEVQLPPLVRLALDAATARRIEADSAAKRSQIAVRAAAIALTHQGLSLRDVGELLGVSRQRAQQLLNPLAYETPKPTTTQP